MGTSQLSSLTKSHPPMLAIPQQFGGIRKRIRRCCVFIREAGWPLIGSGKLD
jgi:hypothetical protein